MGLVPTWIAQERKFQDLFQYPAISVKMSDSEDGLSDGEYPESPLYDGSEGDLDEIARELGEEEDGMLEDTEDSEDDEDDMPEDPPDDDAPGLSTAPPSNLVEEVPGISSLVLLVLKAGHPSWMAERGSKRKKVWRDLLKELRDLPENRGLLDSQWDLRGQVRDRQISCNLKHFLKLYQSCTYDGCEGKAEECRRNRDSLPPRSGQFGG